MAAMVMPDTWATRARYIAELVDADAVAVSIGTAANGLATYARHNLPPTAEIPSSAMLPALTSRAVSVVEMRTPLADARIASNVCAAPIEWRGNVVGSLCALRVDRPWGAEAQRGLAKSAELVALELAETNARIWWQRSAQASARRIRLIEEVRRELAADVQASTFVENAAMRIAKLFGAVGASVMLLEGEGQLVVRSTFGPHQAVAHRARRQVGEGISGWVAQHGEPLILRGAVSDARFDGIDPTIEEALVVPLRVHGRIVGVVATRARLAADVSAPERLRDLDVVASEFASILKMFEESAARVALTSRLESDRREALAMYDLARLAGIGADPEADLNGAIRLIAEAFGHDSVAVWTDDGAGRLTHRSAIGYGEVLPGDISPGTDEVVAAVLATRHARIVRHTVRAAWRSFRATAHILVPIVVAGESAALLVLGRRGDYEAFDLSFASAVGDILSTFMRREIAARLVERSEVERQRMIERMQSEFAEEMSRVVYVLDACQRLLRQDVHLPTDLARAAHDARNVMQRLGIPLAPVGDARADALVAAMGAPVPGLPGGDEGPTPDDPSGAPSVGPDPSPSTAQLS